MIRKSLVFFATLFLLSACGWHLRGTLTLPEGLDRVYLDDDADGEALLDTLDELLTANEVRVADQPTTAQLVINLLSFEEERRVVAVGGNTLVTEYELITEATFSIEGSQGEVLLPPSDLSVIRSYQFDRENVLGMVEEQSLIQNEMRRELAQQIVRRLRFMNLQNGSTPAKGP